MSSSQKIEINEQTCIDLLKKYTEIGFKESSGAASLKEGAILHRYFRILKNQEGRLEKDVKIEDMYKIIFKALEVFNNYKVFNLDDAAVIDKIMTYAEENLMKNKKMEALD